MKLCMFHSSLLRIYWLTNALSPDPGMVDPNDYIAPRNGFAMSFRDFVPHLMNVLDQLGMSLYARTNFIKYVPA